MNFKTSFPVKKSFSLFYNTTVGFAKELGKRFSPLAKIQQINSKPLQSSSHNDWILCVKFYKYNGIALICPGSSLVYRRSLVISKYMC